jgi:hypothetical protein
MKDCHPEQSQESMHLVRSARKQDDRKELLPHQTRGGVALRGLSLSRGPGACGTGSTFAGVI